MKLDNIKSFRLINMYEKLNRGDIINKKEFAEEFGISEKSVQRDIDDLRTYLYEHVIIGTRKEKPVDTGVSELVPFSFS